MTCDVWVPVLQESLEDEGRTHQLDLLRQLCLPTMCLLLHTVLHQTGRYADCMVLADTIASEQHQLYTVSSSFVVGCSVLVILFGDSSDEWSKCLVLI